MFAIAESVTTIGNGINKSLSQFKWIIVYNRKNKNTFVLCKIQMLI